MAKRKYVVLTGPVGKETGVISGPHDGAGWTVRAVVRAQNKRYDQLVKGQVRALVQQG